MTDIVHFQCFTCGNHFDWDFAIVEPVDDDAEPNCNGCGSFDIGPR